MPLNNLFHVALGWIYGKGSGYLVPMQADAHVHLHLCLLSEEEQSVDYFWGYKSLTIYSIFFLNESWL